MTYEELTMLQALPLEIKVLKSKQRLRDAINQFGHEGLYLSISGGKDSTVLHHILVEVEKELWNEIRIPRVFCDTGLEYPEVRQLALSIADVVIRPEKVFVDVLTEYGYPAISKSQAFAFRKLTTMNLTDKYRNKLLHGDEKGTMGKLSNKWHYLLSEDIKISEQCCNVMKKKPFEKYGKLTGRIPIIGVMADEGKNRLTRYVKDGGCNAFNISHPQSRPIGFWCEKDVLKYIYEQQIEIASVYGDVIKVDNAYETTGCKRTGCIFCMFGCHLEKGKNRFEMMKETHPKLYDYCMRGGKYDEKGKWIPYKGLGMHYVLTRLNIRH